MKNYTSYFLIFVLPIFIQCSLQEQDEKSEYQTINGYVSYNSNPIENAEVGFVLVDDTTVIVNTNIDGYFSAELIKDKRLPITSRSPSGILISREVPLEGCNSPSLCIIYPSSVR